MKNISYVLCVCAFLLCCTACRITVNRSGINGDSCSVKGSGNVVTVERPVAAFNSIRVSQGITVSIATGKSDKVSVCADDNLIQYIETEVSGETLSVRLKDEVNIRNYRSLIVYVKTEQIEKLTVSSGADIVGTAPLAVDDIHLKASSAGDIILELEARHIVVSANSGGDITLKGKAETLQVDCSSGADLIAMEMTVRTGAITLSSGAKASVHVVDTLTYSVSSGANLKYKGEPKIKSERISSGGGVRFKK